MLPMKITELYFMTLVPLAAGFIVKRWKPIPTIGSCQKEKVSVPHLYIERVRGFSILKRCHSGSRFSLTACNCVWTVPVVVTDNIVQPETTTLSTDDVDSNTQEPDGFCQPYFRFVYDRTTTSDDKSIPSLRTDTVRFVRLPGSTGVTSAFFGGNGMITVWTMSYITFASKFKFSIRFGMARTYPYEDKVYNLFGDGPCKEYKPRYSLLVNPVKREIYARIQLRNRSSVDLTLQNVSLNGWVNVELKAMNGEIILKSDDRQVSGKIGASTVKSSPCPLEIGKASEYAAGFVGYIDMIEFRNCFGR